MFVVLLFFLIKKYIIWFYKSAPSSTNIAGDSASYCFVLSSNAVISRAKMLV